MPKYVKCPRCDLNYMLEGEELCDVCKAELKKAPPLVFAVDDEEDEMENMELCPRCHRNFVKSGETLCEECLKECESDIEPEAEDDDSWKEYLDDDIPEDEEDSEEMLSLNKLAEEEGEKLFDDEDEEDEIAETFDDDDFDIPDIDESDFEEEDEEEDDEDEEDGKNEKDE